MPKSIRSALGLFGLMLIGVSYSLTTLAQAANDIVGLRLGMSEAEVMATLETHNPAFDVDVFEASYNFSDGANLQQSPAFIDYVQGRSDAAGESITIKFSTPPGPPRAVMIARTTYMHATPPSHAQLAAALEGKYGTATNRLEASAMPSLLWLLGSGDNCLGPNTYPLPRYDIAVLDWLNNVPKAGDGSACAPLLLAQMERVDPARMLTATLVDIAGWAAAERAADGWVAQLEAEAIEARKARGAAPAL